MSIPLSIALEMAARGAAGKLLERGIDAGAEWVRRNLGRYGTEIQARAEANQRDFLTALADRITRKEAELRAGGEQPADLDQRLTDPDLGATLQDALIASARTQSAEKHCLLADAVATRFGAVPESAEAVACAAAVAVIPRLTHNQLNLLGLLTFMHRVTPAPGWPGEGVPSDQVVRTLHAHWTWAVSPYVGATEPRGEDLRLLAFLGCIDLRPGVHSDLRSVMRRGIAPVPEREAFIQEFLASELGQGLEKLWRGGLQNAVPEAIGVFVGRAIHLLRTWEHATTEHPGPEAGAPPS